MNLRIKFAGLAMSAAALALVAASPASAAGPGVGAYVGQTTSLTPVPLTGTPANPAYSFNSLACVGVLAGGPAAGLCTITSSGTYTNIVCGTGTATGTADIVATGPVGAGTTDHVSYTITFVAGIGVMTGQAIGAVVIVATNSGLPDTSQCVTQFTVVGASVLTV